MAQQSVDNDENGENNSSTSPTTASDDNPPSSQLSPSEALRRQAKLAMLEAQKLEMELNLKKIAKLEQALSKSKVKNSQEIMEQIVTLTKQVDPSLLTQLEIPSSSQAKVMNINGDESNNNKEEKSSSTIETNLYKNRFRSSETTTEESLSSSSKPPPSSQPPISEADLNAACTYYMSLSQPMKQTLAKAVNLDMERTSPAIITLTLYDAMNEDGTVKIQNGKTLRQLYLDSLCASPADGVVVDSFKETTDVKETNNQDSFEEQWSKFLVQNNQDGNLETNNDKSSSDIGDDIQKEFDEAISMSNLVESILPRVTRKEEDNFQPTLQDVSFLTNTKDVLNKETFQASQPPESIPGGFIIRGTIASKLNEDGDELIKMLDERIEQVQPQFLNKFQISIIFDPTPQFIESADSISGDPVLLITNKDLRPTTNQFFLAGLTAISLFSTLIFSIATFGSNKVVYQRLEEANSIIQAGGDYDLSWFNGLIFPLLGALAVTQISHEVAQWFFARKGGFKTSAPTILPLMSLPYLTFQSRLKTSPKNLSSLFNYGIAGPAVGIVVSMCFLLIGLQLTLNMDADAVKYAPAVPVYFLKLSSLGGGIVDYVLGGGTDGIILNQDPTTPVILHPFAIGGLAGLMINALDTIPIGATDGGRMSQSLLGRAEQVTFSGILYGGLLLYVILGGHKDLFLAYLLIGSFAQKDLEIPCRNELNKAGLSQAALALVVWCIAFLTLAPM